jgi:alkylated DNA repair dioxygenase AlkB
MRKPAYLETFVRGEVADLYAHIYLETDWVWRTGARAEAFMTEVPGVPYQYGKQPFEREYHSTEMLPIVKAIMDEVNIELTHFRHVKPVNGCFLNRYDNQWHALGWHSDDFEGMDHEAPVAVISLGQPRDIWWRPIGQSGTVPDDQRQLLASGSLFIMPPGFQHTHQHRIPKGDREMGPRVSLTFRRFKE